MRSKRRLIAAILIAVICAPGTFVRTPVTWAPPDRIEVTQIQGSGETGTPGWSVAGVWHYRGERSLLFGGYSALMLPTGTRFVSFSDRGGRFGFTRPDLRGEEYEIALQPIISDRQDGLVDIEAATRDPASGTYWLAFENDHAIHRYSPDHEPTGAVDLDAEALGWSDNSGAEGMVRLDDGRFMILPEGDRTGLIFASDPVAAPGYETFAYLTPVEGHGATDLAQLPDGRVLLLLRNVAVAGGMPPFESKIAIAPAPAAGQAQAWAPQIALDLTGVIPRENYEGLAVRPAANGMVEVWLIADDNLAAIQRTLVVKLVFDPAAVK
ncbi:esterase-like activity of phytase family protein [Erythrobacter sp. MTPC3]|uniref:esterase-like activity of phytase family protein n=1 Tax=Erythrobacter sp. MTPC3 TaxID=3056564 RepID=UPI0036F33153